MGLIIAGFIFFLLSLGLFYLSFKEKNKLAKIQETRTSTARELISPGKPGTLSAGQKGKIVEVKGMIRVEKPLTGPLSKKPCVYFASRVAEKREKVHYDYHRGKRRRHRSTHEHVLSNETRMVNFWVEDTTGKILVNPTGAEVDGLPVVDRFESTGWSGGSSWGFLDSFIGGKEGESILGTSFKETILPVNQRVYVLGEMAGTGPQAAIRKPGTEDGVFLISLKSEEELVAAAQHWTWGLLGGGTVSAISGIALILMGFLSGK